MGWSRTTYNDNLTLYDDGNGGFELATKSKYKKSFDIGGIKQVRDMLNGVIDKNMSSNGFNWEKVIRPGKDYFLNESYIDFEKDCRIDGHSKEWTAFIDFGKVRIECLTVFGTKEEAELWILGVMAKWNQ